MILAEIIDEYVSGDWGNEEFSDDMPNAAFCIRAADFMSILNVDYTNIPIRYFSDSSLENKQLKVGDIVIEKSGGSPTQSTGRVIIVTEELIKEKQHIVCSNFCESFRVKEGWDPFYVFCYLQFLYNERVFFNFEGKTSGLKNLQMEQVFSSIDIPEQKSDISILSYIDKKIALNRRTNNELESLAKLIYDYWFVQFDFPNEEGKPYKSSGGKMVWNETLKREIPEGWEVTKTGIFATIERGTVITEKECSPGKIKVVAAGMDFAYYHNQSNRDENIITISTSGANAGFINFWREPIYASDCMTLQCKNLLDTLLCLQNLRNYQPFVFNMAHGSAQPHVYPEQVYDIPIIKYPQNLKSKIENLFVDINNKIASNIESNKILQSLRDYLLPLLMNGQVTIKD